MAPGQRLLMWSKIVGIGLVIAIGGPYATARLTPTQEELRSRYNPELLKRSLEGSQDRENEFNEFVTKLKEYSKSDKSIWVVIREEEEKRKEAAAQAEKDKKSDAQMQREQMRKEAGLDPRETR